MIEDRIAEVLRLRFEKEDLNSCFLVDVESYKNNKIVVFIDADDGLTIDKCKVVSRFLEHQIEEHNWLPEKYTLDVSSPGVDRPLKLHRQYLKNIGREARVKLSDQRTIEGVIAKVGDNEIVIRHKDQDEEIELNDIIETKILISFKKKK